MRSLIPWRRRDFPMLEPFRQEMETMFHRFFEPLEEVGVELRPWAPRVDVVETEKEIVVKADLPGVDPKDVEISVFDGSLVVKGEKKETKEEKKTNYHRVERFMGQFYREVPLPRGVDPEKIVAKSGQGVVTVTIPKKPEAVPRKVAIKPEG
jgi:HSP20 family protein